MADQIDHEAAVRHARTLERDYRAREQSLYANELRYVAAMADAALVAEQALRMMLEYGANIWWADEFLIDGGEKAAIDQAKAALATIEQARKGE